MDLKLENVLLADEKIFKICDFDMAERNSLAQMNFTGTRYYRAPEVINKEVKEPLKVDIYSLGIIFFAIRTGGMPHTENEVHYGVNFEELLNNSPSKFFDKHIERSGKYKPCFTDDFKELFVNMTIKDPTQRWDIEQVMKSRWCQGIKLQDQDYFKIMETLVN